MIHNDDYKIILFPDFATLQEEVARLRAELTLLLLEKDELLYVECPNIETAYWLALGYLEYRVYDKQCTMMRLKRTISLIQAKKNRQEPIIWAHIEQQLDAEFAEYQRQLNAQLDKVNDALERNKSSKLSTEETKELKKLYRAIVKVLHPDLNPNVTDAQLKLFHHAVNAYERGDLQALVMIHTMMSDLDVTQSTQQTMLTLAQEKERLQASVQSVRDTMEAIKHRYPYTLKTLVSDTEKVKAKKAELEALIVQLHEVIDHYTNIINDMLR